MIPNHLKDVVDLVELTPDCRPKARPWVGIIIHHTGIGDRNPDTVQIGLWRSLLKSMSSWLARKDENILSAHFLIGREGECVMLADPDSSVTFHAGASEYFHPTERRSVPGWNAYAIGIELLGDGNRGAYSEEQYQKLAKLCAVLMDRYHHIDPRCITGHENISPGRKTDPGQHFDWRKFFSALYAELAVSSASQL